MLLVKIRVSTADGWQSFAGQVPDGSDRECYDLPPQVCRSQFWSRKLGVKIPPGRGMIWTADKVPEPV